MTGMYAIFAAIKELEINIADVSTVRSQGINDKKGKKQDPAKAKDKKPRAPWRSKIELDRLYKEGVCKRSTKIGHIGPNCPFLRSARRQNEILSNVDEEKIEDSCSVWENEEP